MQIDIKETEPCKLSVHCVIDAEGIMNKRAKVMDAFRKAPVPGFRPGKASMDAIRVHYKDQIEEALKRALAEDAYHDTIFEKKLRPHGAPRFNKLDMEGGKFNCDFDLFIKPDFQLTEYKGMEIPKPAGTMSPEETCEAMLQELRVKMGEVVPYADTDFVQHGDNVIIDYESFMDGEKVENMCATGEMLTVGQSHLPAFDANLLGMQMGETREFDIIAPENGLPSLAGKQVHLKVTLTIGSKSTPAALDDELAKKLGKKTFAELREAVYAGAAAKSAHAHQMAVHEAVARRMVADTTIPVPNWLALSEGQYLAHQSKLDWNTMSDTDKEKFIQMGEQNVKLSLIFDKVRETEPEAQLTDQEVFEVIKRNLAQTKVQTPIDDVMKEMQRTGYLQILFSRIKDEHTLDFIAKQVKVID